MLIDVSNALYLSQFLNKLKLYFFCPHRTMQPSLHPRPTGPLSGTPSQIPPNAGPVTEQINKVAGKLVDFMRNSLEDIFKELAAHGSPEAMIKALQVFIFELSLNNIFTIV